MTNCGGKLLRIMHSISPTVLTATPNLEEGSEELAATNELRQTGAHSILNITSVVPEHHQRRA